MSKRVVLRGVTWLLIAALRPLRSVLRTGYEATETGPKYFVYDID